VVEKNGGRLGGDLSISFHSSISKQAQLFYKATAHVDGTDNSANGICRLILSFLSTKLKYYGTQQSNEVVDAIEELDAYRAQELRESEGYNSGDY
jgi:hypothetical protein